MAAPTQSRRSGMELLFLDTFSHDTSEALNLDLIQFAHPVRISEVRIIPLGSKVELRIPGGARLGATNPSKFHLEAFINDQTKSKAATFQKIGSLDFHENNLVIRAKQMPPTDGLIVKGGYSTITVAVLGCSADAPEPEKSASPPPTTDTIHGQTEQWVAGLPSNEPVHKQDPAMIAEPVESQETSSGLEEQDVVPSESSEALQEQLYGDLAAPEGGDSDEQEIYTEEDVLAGDMITTDETGYDEAYDGFAAYPTFNPYQFEGTQLNTYFSSTLSQFEVERIICEEMEDLTPAANKLLEVIEQFHNEPHHDSWVEKVEAMCPLIAPGLASLSASDNEKFSSALSTLISWTLEGLNLEAAMAQPETPFKVRHLKMGLRLVNSMLILTEEIATKLLKLGIEATLFNLFRSPNMAASLRLMTVAAMDSLTHFPCGMIHFLGLSEGHQLDKTGYQQLLDLALEKKMTRIVVAISALMRKLHVYEILTNLHTSATQVADSALECFTDNTECPPVTQTGDESGGGGIASGDVEMQGLYDEAGVGLIDEEQADVIVVCLEEVCSVLKHAKNIIAQPSLRSLPVNKCFTKYHEPSDPYPSLYQMIDSTKFLQVLFLLLSSPNTSSHSGVFTAVRSCLQQLIKSQRGLLFLAAHVETTNGIIRLLLQSADFDKESEADDHAAQALGLQLVYHLQALQYMDQFKEFWERTDSYSLDDVELLGTLHAMLGLTISSPGREALVTIISWDMTPFFKLVPSQVKEDPEVKPKITIAAKYFSDLMQVVMMYNTEMTALEPHLANLLALSNYGDEPKVMMPLMEWLEPFKGISKFDHTCVPALVKSFHSYVDQLPTVEVGLASCLRLMHHIAIPPSRPSGANFTAEELSYQHALLELFSRDCLIDWVKILDKLSEKHLHSWQRGVALPVSQRDVQLSIVSPTLKLMKAVLGQLIEARGVQFQDTSALLALFRCFTVVCTVPPVGTYSHTVTEIQRDIIDILAAYTQPTLTGSEADINDAMATSLWTSMLQSLLTYTVSHPCAFLSGALMLSELLPIPLPVQCSERLSPEETKLMINNRKLWSAHLLPVTENLDVVITTMAGSNCLHLQHAFRRVCWQLSDLTSHFASLVTHILLKAFADSLSEPAVPSGGTCTNNEQQSSMEAGVVSTNIASAISYLSSHAPVKAALLQTLRSAKFGEEESDTSSTPFVKLLTVLNTVSEKNSHTQCQGHIVTLLQCLCDLSITLTDATEETTLQVRLINDIPDRASLDLITQAFMEHIGNYDHCYTSILLSLRTLVILTDFSFSFKCLTRSLERNTQALYNLFTRINNTFSKDSSDCISTLSTALEFIRLLVCSDVDSHPEREATLTTKQLRQVLKWDAQPHPLDDLEKLLVDLVEESLEGIVANITNITQLLKTDSEKDTKQKREDEKITDVQEKTENSQEENMDMNEENDVMSLQEQFTKRSIFIIPEQLDVDKLTTSYWLSNLMADDSDEPEPNDNEPTDLIQICEMYLKDFNLEKELSKTESDLDALTKVAVTTSRKKEVLSLGQGGGTFKAPMRGISVMRRGQQRGRGNFGSGRGDAFRTRTPNTSRPPSMHVDDFVKMETNDGSAVQTDASQVNRSPFQLRDGGMSGYDPSGRGGRQFIISPDGRSFPNFRGGFRGGRGSPMRGAGSPRGFYDRGRGARFGGDRFGGRGGGNMMAIGGMQLDSRRGFTSPGHNARHSASPVDRRNLTNLRPMVASMGDLRDGMQYSRHNDSRLMPPPQMGDMRQPRSSERRDGSRDSYRSYSK